MLIFNIDVTTNMSIRRALPPPRSTRSVNGLRVFDLPRESPKVSSEKVRALDASQR